MKKLILTFTILVSTLLSYSQFESIFGTTSTSWNILSRTPGTTSMDSLIVCCDTTINSETYKKIDIYSYSQTAPVKFSTGFYFVREDTTKGRAWLITSSDTSELLFHDMSLKLGDTLFVKSGIFKIADSVYLTGGKKTIRLSRTGYNCTELQNESYVMTDGIGFINEFNVLLGVNYCDFLLCKRKDEVLVYQNTSSAYGGYCNSNLVSTSEKQLDKLITIYPNPSNSNITIVKKDLEKITSIKLFNVNGKIISSYNPFINNIDVSNYEKGIYFILFETEKGSIYKKIVVN